jgi:hypothetical protein
MRLRILAPVWFGLFASVAQADGEHVGRFESISLQRSGCYGTCPEYSVTVHFDGKVEYNGLKNVPHLGPKTSKINVADVQFLADAIDRLPLAGLRQVYRRSSDGCVELWTDNPTTTITLHRRGESRTVEYYEGCRGAPEFQRILWLAATIDEVAQVMHPLTISEKVEP